MSFLADLVEAGAPRDKDAVKVLEALSTTAAPAAANMDSTETLHTRQAPGNSAIVSLKHEHSSRTQSPLRESSLPMPSTELPPAAATTTSAPRKRPPPKNSVKKGIASTVKKDPSAVKKTSSKSKSKPAATKRIASTTATPANSSPAPRSVRASSTPRSSPEADHHVDNALSGSEAEDDGASPGVIDDDQLYCLCHRPDTGTFMIGCDGGCEDWFHGKCVGVSEKNKNLIDRYICPNCQEKGIGITTWKRMCRREGCRMPARIHGSNTSKYCSDECGVLFFKDMMAKARKTVTASNPTKSSKKNTQETMSDPDLGPRGGLLSIAEVKAMLNAASTCEGFRSLGQDVTSYPDAAPASDSTAKNTIERDTNASVLNDIERERIDYIKQQKLNLKDRHLVLKDRSKFIGMVRNLATHLAEERNVKAKDMCGFDERITWTEDQFRAWRESPEGKEALRTSALKPVEHDTTATDAEGDNPMNGNSGGEANTQGPCTKRKCAKHFDWHKLALDDTRFETGENGETMRALEREEKEIKERAQLRAREIRAGGVGGTVEFHQQSAQESQKGQEEEDVHPDPMDTALEIKVEDSPMIEAGTEEQGSRDEKTEVRSDVDMKDVTAT